MARPSRIEEKRRALLPIVARAFAELGYRRTTTRELAARCGVQENILYRIWPDKKAMFIAAIGYVYDLSTQVWRELLEEPQGSVSGAERLLAYEARHHGEFGHYRIIFAGLSETDDPEIRAALADMYKRYQRFIREQIRAHRGRRKAGDVTLAAWAVIGLGTVASVLRELELAGEAQRRKLLSRVGRLLLKAAN